MESRWDFEALVERADLDMTELAAAEDLLRGAPAEPVSREWIAATVERVTAPARRRRYWLPQRLPLVAAILLGMLVCTAAVTVALWSGRNSSFEMTYPVAIRLLLEPQHEESDRRSALTVINGRVRYGIERLKLAARDAGIADVAAVGLSRIEHALVAPPLGSPEAVDDSLDEAVVKAFDRSRSIMERHRSVERVTSMTENGIVAMLLANLDAEAEVLRELYVKQLRRQILQR